MASHKSNIWCVSWDCIEIVCRVAMLGCIAAVGVSLLLTGCSKSSKPKPVRYNIYIGNTQTDQMYILDSDSLTVRDSIPGLGSSLDMLVSPDGQWLYVSRSSPLDANPLLKVNSQTRQQSAARPGGGSQKLGMLKNGEVILWGNGYFYGGTLSATTLSDERRSNDSLRWRDGPGAGMRIAVGFHPGGLEGPSLIRVLDLQTGELTGSYVPHMQSGEQVGAYQVMLLSDNRRVIVAGPSLSGCCVLVGDVTNGETLLQFDREGCNGEIAISPDGAFAAISDPSYIGHPEAPEPGIDIIGLRNLSHLKRFRPTDFGVNSWDLFSQICFTADSRRLIVAPRSATPGWVHVIDLTALQVEEVVWPDTGFAWIGAMGYGPQPR